MFIFVQKLKLVKLALKSLHRSEYAKMSERIKETRRQLADIQEAVQENPLDEQLMQIEKNISGQYDALLQQELMMLKPKAKIDYF